MKNIILLSTLFFIVNCTHTIDAKFFAQAEAEFKCVWVKASSNKVNCWCYLNVFVDGKNPVFYTSDIFQQADDEYCIDQNADVIMKKDFDKERFKTEGDAISI